MPILKGLGFQYLKPELNYTSVTWVVPVAGNIYPVDDPLGGVIPIPAGGMFLFQKSNTGDGTGQIAVSVKGSTIPVYRNFMFVTDEYNWSKEELEDFANFMLAPLISAFTNFWLPLFVINEKTNFNFQNTHHGSSSPNVEVSFYRYNKTSGNGATCTVYGAAAGGEIPGVSLSVYYSATNVVRIGATIITLSQPLRIVTTGTYDFIALMFRPTQRATELVAEDIYHDVYESFTELLYIQEPVTPVAPNLYMQLEKNYNCPCKDNMNLVIEYDETTSNRLDVYKDGELIQSIEVGNAES